MGTYFAGGTTASSKPLASLRVASSTATTAEKAGADYVCDGTADDVEINAAITALTATGGTITLSEGTFNLAATISIAGTNFADTPTIALTGAGADATILNAASNITAITLTNTPKPHILKMRINYSGSADAIRCTAPTTGANDRRGFWMGRFEDLKIHGDNSTNTGWALNMESPFRSTFKRIQVIGSKNGVWLKSHYSAFNPGNLTFENCHMDLAIAGGTAWRLQSADGGGFFNICTFIECDCIDSSGSSTTSYGWLFQGSTTTFYTTRDILILRSNIEQFTYAAKFEHTANVEFNANYCETKTAGTAFHLSSDSVNNQLSVQYLYVPSPKSVTAINDANTDVLKPNTLRNSFTRVETGGTLSMTKSAATVLQALYRDSDGSGVYPSEWQGQVGGLSVKDEGTELFRGVRSMNFTGSAVTATNSGGDITVSVTGGSGGGDASTNTASSVDSEVVLFSGTTGKILKRSALTGMAKMTSGVMSAASAGTDYVLPSGNITGTAANVTGTVAVGNGGTGATTLTGILKGNGTGAFTAVTAPAGTIVGTTDTQTLTNKDLSSVTNTMAASSSITSSATPAPTGDSRENELYITALAAAALFSAPSGTPSNGNELFIRIKDNGTARALTWNAIYLSSGVASLLTTTVVNKTHTIFFKYDSTAAKWICMAVDATGY